MTSGQPEQTSGCLEATYLAHRSTLLRYLRSQGAGDAAEDLVQELWIRLSAVQSASVDDPVAYMYRAARNLMIGRHNARTRTEAREKRFEERRVGWVEPSFAEVLVAREEIDAAERRLRELGIRVLRTFSLFRVDGLPQRQIADQLGVSLSTVEKDLQRAYRAIADLRSENDAV